jgi:hypothetical protein
MESGKKLEGIEAKDRPILMEIIATLPCKNLMTKINVKVMQLMS